MSYVVLATEMNSGMKKPLVIETKLIDEQNMPELGKLLKKNVNLAKRDVAIYIVISEKMLLKKARRSTKVTPNNDDWVKDLEKPSGYLAWSALLWLGHLIYLMSSWEQRSLPVLMMTDFIY